MKLWLPLAGLCSLIIGLIGLAPADKVLAYALPAEAPVKFYEVSGRLLQGQIGAIETPQLMIEDLRWQLRPGSLLLARISADVEASPAGNWAQASLSTGLLAPGETVKVKDLRATASLENLKAPLKLPFLPVAGQLSAEISRLTLRDQQLSELDGSLRLGKVQWTLTRPAAELGQFLAELSMEDDVLVASLADQDAKLALSGDVRLNPDRSYLLDMRLKPKADTPAPVANNLKTLGRTDAQGWYRINQRGSLAGR